MRTVWPWAEPHGSDWPDAPSDECRTVNEEGGRAARAACEQELLLSGALPCCENNPLAKGRASLERLRPVFKEAIPSKQSMHRGRIRLGQCWEELIEVEYSFRAL